MTQAWAVGNRNVSSLNDHGDARERVEGEGGQEEGGRQGTRGQRRRRRVTASATYPHHLQPTSSTALATPWDGDDYTCAMG